MKIFDFITLTQLLQLFVPYALAYLVLVFISRRATKDDRTASIVFLAMLINLLLYAAGFYISLSYLNAGFGYSSTLSLWIATTINLVNLGTLFGEYLYQLHHKNFDVDHVTRAHFSWSVNLFFVALVASIGFSVILPYNMIVLIWSGVIPGLLSIFANHLLARKFLFD